MGFPVLFLIDAFSTFSGHASKGVMHDPDFFDKLDVGAHRIQSGGDLISEYVASKDVMHDPVFF